jgi:hypothetical protein
MLPSFRAGLNHLIKRLLQAVGNQDIRANVLATLT